MFRWRTSAGSGGWRFWPGSPMTPVSYTHLVIIGPDTEAVWISGTELKAGTLADALSAVASKGGTIDLVNNATLADAKFVISKNVTIQKSAVATNVPAISATVAAGETAGAFTVTENASLTLNGVKLVVQGLSLIHI